jgi:hypothetical protein
MRAHRPIFNSSLASDAGYLPLESLTGSGAPQASSVAPAKATVATKVGSPTLALGAISITPTKATAVTRITPPVLALPAVTLTPAKGTIVTKSGQVTVTLGSISVTVAKGTVATKVGVPTLTLGAITVAPNKATIVTSVGIPTFSGIPIDIYPDAGAIVTAVSEAVLLYTPPPVRGGHGKKPTFAFVRPKPPTQLEKEIKAMVDVYRTEASIKAQEQSSERQRLQTLEMGRRQMDINRQLNRQPKERKEAQQKPLIDDVKLQKMIERAQKQTQDEISLAKIGRAHV